MKQIKQLKENGFNKVIVTKEESGDKNDYYYYSYEINSDVILVSNESDEINNNQWKVYEHSWGVAMTDIEDVVLLIDLFKKWSKIPL
jgi:hypothetical protein